MKENVKIDKVILTKVRARSKKMGMTIGGYVEMWLKHSFIPRYNIGDNSDAFRRYLDENKIKYESNGSFTTLIDVSDPISVGMEWGVYKYQNSPFYKNVQEKEIR